jgi:tryptophan 2,3-dioxygenase
VRALDGFPTAALGGRMTRPLFPELWKVRVERTQTWSREGGFAPGEMRCPYAEAAGQRVEA